jgi:hypothetical protein
MDPVSNADRLVRLLRQRLAERGKAQSGRSASAPSEVQHRDPATTKAITGNFARAGGTAQALRRTLIEQLLTDQFGAAMANEPKFQQIVDRVASAMNADPDIAAMMEQVIGELKRSPV